MDPNATTAPVATHPASPAPAATPDVAPRPAAAPQPTSKDGQAERTAAEKADSQARLFAVIAAVVPTVLAAQGMILFASDVLRMPLHFAWMLACFLELALVAAALLDRAAAVRGRSSRGLSTYAFSTVSGCLSALHELVERTPAGGSEWTFDPFSILAALIRIAAPLTAAWLWHRVLIGLRYTAEGKTEVQAKRDKRMHAAARAAQELARAEKAAKANPGFLAGRRVVAAERKRDRTWDRVLRIYPASEETMARDFDRWLRAIGAADLFSKRTDVTNDDVPTLEAATQVPAAPTAKRRPSPKPRQAAPQQAPRQQPTATARSAQSTTVPAAVVAAPQQASNVHPFKPAAEGEEKDPEKRAAKALFDQAIAADPTTKPDAAWIRREAGVTKDGATVRRWVTKWMADLPEIVPPATGPSTVDDLVNATTPSEEEPAAKEA